MAFSNVSLLREYKHTRLSNVLVRNGFSNIYNRLVKDRMSYALHKVWCSRHRGLWLDSRPIQSGILHSKTPYEREGGMRRAPNGPHNETQIQWAPSGSVLVGFCVRVSKHLTTRYWETSFPHHVSMRVGILHSGIHEEQQEITSLCWTGPERGPLLNTAEDLKNLCATAGTCVSLVCKWAQVIGKKKVKMQSKILTAILCSAKC